MMASLYPHDDDAGPSEGNMPEAVGQRRDDEQH